MSGRTHPGDADAPLIDRYDVALLDLDGVVYVGAEPVPGAAEALAKAAAAGQRRAFVTNNASRTPEEVARLLGNVGVDADPGEVVTSAQAAARLLAEELSPGAMVLVVGSDALAAEVRGRGLRVTDTADDDPAAVVQGYSPQVGYRNLAEATIAVRRGAWWVATNTDLTIPSPRGIVPGNGCLVGVVRAASGVEPVVAGKPHPALHRESMLRTRAATPLIVGDRLDTDIEGATAAGVDSLVVLTGVTTPASLLAATPAQRPTYVAAGLDGLLVPHPVPEVIAGSARCGRYQAVVDGAAIRLSSTGGDAATVGEQLDALRALCAAMWHGGVADGTPAVTAGDATAEWALHQLGLGGTEPAATAAPGA